MRKTNILVSLAAGVLLLAACGQAPARTGSSETPSATASESPSASPTSAPTPLTIPGPSFAMAEVGLAYAPVMLAASGGATPYTWTVSAGALPNGLAISADGVVSGTPAKAGKFAFTLEVTDANAATANLSGSITVATKLVLQYIKHSYSSVTGYPILNVCVEGRADHPCPDPDERTLRFATVTGGAPPYTYALASGTLPPKSWVNGLGLAWQTPAYALSLPRGDYTITIRVTDSLGASVVGGVEYWLYAT